MGIALHIYWHNLCFFTGLCRNVLFSSFLNLSVLFVFDNFFFFVGGSLFETGSPYVAQASWPHTCDPLAPVSQMLGLQVCATTPG
jgi:hypothetical protein